MQQIRLEQGHCDPIEVSRQTTEDAVATKSRDANRVKRGLLSELISSITVTITIRQLSRQRGLLVTQNTNSPLVRLVRKK